MGIYLKKYIVYTNKIFYLNSIYYSEDIFCTKKKRLQRRYIKQFNDKSKKMKTGTHVQAIVQHAENLIK